MIDDEYKIELDLDRKRIKSVLTETYRVSADILGIEFAITENDFVSKIDPFLESNRVSVPVTLYLPSRKYPGMYFDVDLRKKSVIVRLPNRKKRIELNRYLTKL